MPKPRIGEKLVVQMFALKAEGVSETQIAKKLGVSRSTIAQYLAGKHPAEPVLVSSNTLMKDGSPMVRSDALTRCPTCGGKVMLPCILCHVKEQMNE